MAKHASSTPASATRRTAARPVGGALDRRSLPPDAPTKGTVRPTAAHFFGVAIVPDAYGAPLHGDCLEPVMCDGDMALVSPTELPDVGDLVVLYHVKGGTPWLKRLVMAPLVPVGLPLHPDSDVVPMVAVEMLNPPKQFMFGSDQLRAMHKVVGLIRKDEVEALRNLPPVPAPKPARRRKVAA